MRRLFTMRRIARRAAIAVIGLAAILASVTVLAPAAKAEDSYQITLDMNECDVMAVGVTGTCIISLQTWLNIFDRAGLVVDGNFGPATEAAVKDFQSRHGLVPDGQFGNLSRNALRGEYQNMVANSVPTPSPAPAPRCNTATGDGCDYGGVVPGFNGGDAQSIFCGGVGLAAGLARPDFGAGAGIFCSIVLN
jgi:peptidoglycan hydrolase-like protein with peptidoglycan-binding domain